MGSIIELKVLGGAELSASDGIEFGAVLAQPKRLALLTYLALSRESRFARRDTIVGAFWPELDDAHARNALSQALRFLRRQLGDAIIIRRGDDEIALNRDLISCDAEQFTQARSSDDHIRAVELYRGDLLTGFFVNDAPGFDLWLEERRSDLARRYRKSLEGAADQHVRAGNMIRAAECWERRAVVEPYNSAVAMKLMLALAAAGDRPRAIEHASVHTKRLRAELETEPNAAIAALAERLRVAEATVADIADRADVPQPAEDHGVVSHPQSVAASMPPNDNRVAWSRLARHTRVAALPVIGIAAVVLSLLAIRASDGGPHSKRVVVAIFENQTGDTSLEPLGAMAADWITQGLQTTGFVDVVPFGTMHPVAPDSSRAAPRSEMQDVRELARLTDAAYVVGGVIHLDREKLRFQPQIIEVSSLRLVGAPAAVVVERGDATRGIEQLRQHVAGSLASVLDPRVASWAATASNPPSLAAFSEFQVGVEELLGHHNSPAAIAHFQRAADADSSYVVPRLWMIDALMRMGTFSAPRVDSILAALQRSRDRLAPADALLLDRFEALRRNDRAAASRASLMLAALAPSSYFVKMLAEDAAFANQAREAVQILSQLDPAWPWVRDWQDYWALLAYELHATGDFTRELEVARQARATRPASRRFLWLECQALAALGRVDEVEQLISNVDMLPLSDRGTRAGDFLPDGLLRNVGLELRAHGAPGAGRAMLERADAWYSARARVRLPTIAAQNQNMLLLAELGRWPEAAAAARSVLDSFPESVMPLSIIGIAAASLGDTSLAHAQLALLTLPDTGRDVAVRTYEAAKIAAALGEREHAIDLLRKAFAGGWRHTFWDHLATTFEALRPLPAYQELVRPTN